MKISTIADWLSYIEALHPEEIVLGLDRIKQVADIGGLLDFHCPIVLVGGTNGKGSTVASLASLLMHHGLRVGTYFSPHLLRFNERIAINGECIQDEALCAVFEKIEAYRTHCIHHTTPVLTFFEFTTLAALQFFKESDCDIIILEVGLGGRLDAVNIVEPALSIITTLGLDHTDRLGNTIDEIAIEKAGIVRENKPVLVAKQAENKCLLARIEKAGAFLIQENKDFGWQIGAQKFGKNNWYYKKTKAFLDIATINIPLASVSLALAAFHTLAEYYPVLKIKTTDMDIPLALGSAALPGRFQRYRSFDKTDEALTIFDVAHNPLGAQYLSAKLNHFNTPHSRCIAVWSSLKDKDITGIVNAMRDSISLWVIAPLVGLRASSIEELKQALKLNNISEESIVCEPTIEAAYHRACTLAEHSDTIVVFGSFVTVGQVMAEVDPDCIYQSAFYKKNS